ncbi:MAG TPA: DUF1932 domain-containing protein, partial [Acidimicrobiia bacterium]
DETWENLVAQFDAADEAFLRRLVDGTAPHATRRLHEMEAAETMLRELGLEPTMTRGTVASLRRIADGAPVPELPRPAGGTRQTSRTGQASPTSPTRQARKARQTETPSSPQ